MVLLTLTLDSRNYFLPESPLSQMIAYCTRRFRSYSPILFRDFVLIAFAIPYHWSIPMDKYLQPSFLILFQVDLVKTRCLEPLSVVPRILWAYCYTVFATWIPLRIISRTSEYPLIPSCSGVSQKSLKYYSILRKSLAALLLCKYLSTCIMDASHISGNIH